MKAIRAFLSTFWFPITLGLLLLAAVPGVVLLILNLTGRQAQINADLQRDWKLTYHLPLPSWATFLLLLVPLLLVLLYFLKLKRRPISVPSTFLWKKSIEDMHVNSLFQWLRKNVLLLLQMLVLLALIYGVMAFHLHGRTGAGKHYILMIDNSASMSATDLFPSRLEWAKEEALKEIEGAAENDVGMVIVFNNTADILQTYTTNRGLLRRAVQSIGPTQKTTRIDEALTLAESYANPTRSTQDLAMQPEGGAVRTLVQTEGVQTQVHLYSDGGFPPVPDFTMGNLNLVYHGAGRFKTVGHGDEAKQVALDESMNNIAVASLNAVRDESDPTKVKVFLAVRNYRPEAVSVSVVVDLMVNGTLRDSFERSLLLGPRRSDEISSEVKVDHQPDEAQAIFEVKEIDDRNNYVAHARLLKVNDAFALDDQAWLVLGTVRKARILIVGHTNEVLDAFFRDKSVKDVADVKRVSPDGMAEEDYKKAARNGDYDLVIYDRCGPAKEADMPRSSTFFIGHPPPPWELAQRDGKKAAKIENPMIRGWETRHPVMKYLVALHEVGIDEAFVLSDLPPRTPKLMEIENDRAIMLTLPRGPYTDLVMTFPIMTDKGEFNTNWPLLPSFPIFMRNVIYALGNISDSVADEWVRPGQVRTIRLDDPVKEVTLVEPSGKTQTLKHDERSVRTEFTFRPPEVGIYRVLWGQDRERDYATNLLDARESDIMPRGEILIGAEAIAADQERHQPMELWRWFALAAFLLLLLEWYIYNKRVYV